jgi:pyridoxamine 5'-phosphate oxidase
VLPQANQPRAGVPIQRASHGRETGRVDVTDLDDDPLRQRSIWLDAARAAGQPMPEAVTIATATSDGVPSARLVVLRGIGRGLVFFTDCGSDKGAELAANPQAAAVLHWLVPVHRQARVAGPAERVGKDEADEYWSGRPAVRLSAASSRQSRVVASRTVLPLLPCRHSAPAAGGRPSAEISAAGHPLDGTPTAVTDRERPS